MELTLTVIGLMLGVGDPSPDFTEITFDSIVVDDVEFIDPDTFADLGLVGVASYPVQDLESSAPAWWWDGFLVPGGITAPNVLPLQPALGLEMEFTFLTPDGCPGLIDYFEVRGFDSEAGSVLGLVQLFNVDGDLISELQLFTPADRTDLFTLIAPNATRVRLATDPDGASFDNMIFSTPSISITPDINRDGVVDSDDIGAMFAEWGACTPDSCCLADLDRDGVVNAHDLARLLANWG